MRTGLMAFVLVWLGVMQPCDAADTRPNLLFIFADDWGRHAGAYAALEPGGINDLLKTPNIDALAARGVLFRNAFVNAPSCTPCRSALVSGRHFWQTGRGGILQGAIWDEQIPVFPLLLRDSGYAIGKSYKVWGPGQPNDGPYGQQKYAFNEGQQQVSQFSQNATRMVAEGTSFEEARARILSHVRKNFQAFLKTRQPDQPFCYWFGPTNTHRKWQRGSGKALWGMDPDQLKGKLPAFLPDVDVVREDLCDYLGEVMALDAMVGVLQEELQNAGESDRTVIALSGDHGAPGFPHGKCNLYDFGTRVSLVVAGPGVQGGRVVDDMVSIPDLAPTFLEAGNLAIPEGMSARSLWPVLKSDKNGQVDPARNAVLIGRERHVALAREGALPYPQRAIRTRDHLLIINFQPERRPLGDPLLLDSDQVPTFDQLANDTMVAFSDDDAGPTKAWLVTHRDDPQWKPFFERTYGVRPREEFYVLATDPDQMVNRAGDPDVQLALEGLRSRLMGELKRTGDPRVTGDGQYYERAPLAGPVTPPNGQGKARRNRQ